MNASLRRSSKGFSLVEVSVALGLTTFTLLTVVGLMLVGLQTASVSGQETQAINLLSAAASDLQNVSLSATESKIFKFSPAPWAKDNNHAVVVNPSLQAGKTITVCVTDNYEVVPPEDPLARFRLTLRYTRVPGASGVASLVPGDQAGSSPLAPIEAVLIVSWPASKDPMSSENKPQGWIESYLTFRKPL